MSAGSMDNENVRIVNVDNECALALIVGWNRVVDVKCKIAPSEAARILRELADQIEARG